MPIVFYKIREPYGGFSNFSRHAVTIYGATWPTSEHAYQAQKFHPHRPDLVEAVRNTATPRAAADMGRSRQLPLAGGWEKPLALDALRARIPDHVAAGRADIFSQTATTPLFSCLKDVVMYEVIYAKLAQHPDLTALLLGTGTERIIEGTPVDPYWGWGSDERGENKLGRIFMVIRTMLRDGATSGKPSCLAV